MSILKKSNIIAENDKLRSECIRKLVQKPNSFHEQIGPTIIPKIIVQFWHDLNHIPLDVQECIESWRKLIERGFKHFIYDDTKARNFIRKHYCSKYVTAFNLCNHPAMRCDYFRLCYILKFGGFYVDADEVYQGKELQLLFNNNYLKVQPLCYDILKENMVNPTTFLKVNDDSLDWIFYVNNNPIVAPPKHPVIRIALNRATRIILNQEAKLRDIQSTTGPGNLSASLVKYWIWLEHKRKDQDFYFLSDWDSYSISKWPLSYRNDERNWRIWLAGEWQSE
jgi:mannosyltransferase OCH1-like enzyme